MPTGENFRFQTLKKYNVLEADIGKLWVSSRVGLFPSEMVRKNDFCKHTDNQTGV
jgi:hypothetical protein